MKKVLIVIVVFLVVSGVWGEETAEPDPPYDWHQTYYHTGAYYSLDDELITVTEPAFVVLVDYPIISLATVLDGESTPIDLFDTYFRGFAVMSYYQEWDQETRTHLTFRIALTPIVDSYFWRLRIDYIEKEISFWAEMRVLHY